MKIAVLRNAWREADYGGAEEFALNLVDRLTVNGVDAYVLSGTTSLITQAKRRSVPARKGPYSKYQILTKHRFVHLPRYLFDLYRAYKGYSILFREHQPDLIHTTGQQDSIAATKAAHKLGIPIIWSDHGELKNSLGRSAMPPWGIPGMLLRRQAKNVKTICMVNPDDVKAVKSLIPGAPITILPNGVPDNQRPTKTSQYTLVYASRIIREKGIFELLEALKTVQVHKPETSLLIAGTGPSSRKVKEAVKQLKLQNVTFEDYSDAAIANGNIFVLPTYTEAQSLAILKAMMYKTPIISTAVAGNTHFLRSGQNALLVPPKNSRKLADAITELLDNKTLRQEIVKTARKDYEKNNRLTTIVKTKYLPLYARFLGRT